MVAVAVFRPHVFAPEVVEMSTDLESLQEAVGGFVEVLSSARCTVVCNEEGRVLGLDRNVEGTRAALMLGVRLGASEVIRGPVLVLGPDMSTDEEDLFGDLDPLLGSAWSGSVSAEPSRSWEEWRPVLMCPPGHCTTCDHIRSR